MARVPQQRLRASVSVLIHRALRTGLRGKTWERAVGYTLPELVSHLEARFTPGMTWENYGKWHVDHIRPVASFVMETIDDAGFRDCWALSNLQPLWADANRRKGKKTSAAA